MVSPPAGRHGRQGQPDPRALPPHRAQARRPAGGARAVAANSVLCHLQSRPCRARKRGRTTVVPVSPPASAAAKRKRPPCPVPLRCASPVAHRRGGGDGDEGACARERAGRCMHVPGIALAGQRGCGRPGRGGGARPAAEAAVRPVGSIIHIASVVVHGACADAATCTAAASKTAEEVEAELEADALPAVV
ncbi:hypothetical protein ACQ4PT_049474 [Festuca glaucescens]